MDIDLKKQYVMMQMYMAQQYSFHALDGPDAEVRHDLRVDPLDLEARADLEAGRRLSGEEAVDVLREPRRIGQQVEPGAGKVRVAYGDQASGVRWRLKLSFTYP